LSAQDLPPKLVSFNANLDQQQAKTNLTWTTDEEININHFVIERSTDGEYYSKQATVFANANTGIKNDYVFSDNIHSLAPGLVYYRLRTVNKDGKFQFSKIRIIRLNEKSENAITVLTFPNPITNELKVTIPASWQNKRVSYELFGLNSLSIRKTEKLSSSQTETINVSYLHTGIYLMKVSCEGQTAQQKIFKN
jgi:hypothetical protein